MKTKTKKIGFIRVGLTFFVCLGIMVVLSLIALRIGSVEYSTSEIISALMDPTSTTYTIIVNLRLPRVILAILVGMCLAASGTLLQAVMQNPLADPGIIGVSSGASVVATIVFLVTPDAHPLPSLTGLFRGSSRLFSDIHHGLEEGRRPHQDHTSRNGHKRHVGRSILVSHPAQFR